MANHKAFLNAFFKKKIWVKGVHLKVRFLFEQQLWIGYLPFKILSVEP